MTGSVAVDTCRVTGFCKKSLPVPQLKKTYVMIILIGMRVLFAHANLDNESFTSLNVVGTNDMRHVAVEIIAHYLLIFLFYLNGFEYSWHGFLFLVTTEAA